MKSDISEVSWEIRPYRYRLVEGVNSKGGSRRVEHIGQTVMAIFPSGRTVEVPGLGPNEADYEKRRKAVEAHNRRLRIIEINGPRLNKGEKK